MKLKKKSCLICGRTTNKHITICDNCYLILSPKAEKVLRDFQFVDEAYACFYYNELLKETIYKYKFEYKRYFLELFAELLIEEIFLSKLHKKVDRIISVPLFKDTLLIRGFNQIELLEDLIYKLIGLKPIKNNLVKTLKTKEQARLDGQERKINLNNAFKLLKSEEVKGKSILLLDDMITTGSTVEECARILKEGGAKRVIALSIATTH